MKKAILKILAQNKNNLKEKSMMLASISVMVTAISCGGGDDNPTAQSTEINTNVPPIAWSDVMGGSHISSRGVISFDPQSNILLAGAYDGDPLIDPLPPVTVGIPNGFILKLSNQGKRLFAQDLGFMVATDLNYLAFTKEAILLAGTYLPTGGGDVFYFSLDEEGNQLGVNILDGSTRNDEAGGLAVDPSGNILIGGTIGGGLSESANVTKVDADENVQWSYTSSGRATLANVETDDLGNVYLNQCSFPSSSEAEFIKLDANGNVVWAKSFGLGCGSGLSVVSSNEIYLNYLNGIIRLDGNGDIVWQLHSQSILMSDLDANANGDIGVCGTYGNGGEFGSITLPNPPRGVRPGFIAMLNANGTVRWMTDEVSATDVSVNANGSTAYANISDQQISYGLLE